MWVFLNRKEHEKCEFEVHEVYAVDVLVSSGEGKVIILQFINVPYVQTFNFKIFFFF